MHCGQKFLASRSTVPTTQINTQFNFRAQRCPEEIRKCQEGTMNSELGRPGEITRRWFLFTTLKMDSILTRKKGRRSIPGKPMGMSLECSGYSWMCFECAVDGRLANKAEKFELAYERSWMSIWYETTVILIALHKFAPLFHFSVLWAAFQPHSASPFSADKLHTSDSSGLFLHEAFPDYSHTIQTLTTPQGSQWFFRT